jgi:hypothetical protein
MKLIKRLKEVKEPIDTYKVNADKCTITINSKYTLKFKDILNMMFCVGQIQSRIEKENN